MMPYYNSLIIRHEFPTFCILQTVYCHITDGGDITYLPIVVTVHRKSMQTRDDGHNVDRKNLGLI